MIKWIRIIIVVLFVIVAGFFLYTKITAKIDSDTRPPVITADTDELTVSVEATDKELMEGITAVDDRDGDVSDSMVVVSKSKFIRPGVSNITYAAFDSHNNVATYTRRVTYSDYHSPEYAMDVPLVFSATDRNVDYLENIHAADSLDGDLTSVIRLSSGIQTTQDDGSITMPLDLSVVNSSGDMSEIELDVIYLDEKTYQQDAPALSDYIVYTTVGKKVDAASYLIGVRNGINTRLFAATGYLDSDVFINSEGVDYQNPGVYKIIYTLYPHGMRADSSSSKVALGKTELYVVVRE